MMLLVLTGTAHTQELPNVPVSKESWGMFAVVGAEILADSVTTRVLYQRHYRENDPIAQPFVRAGVPGQIGASLLGAGALGGAWLVLRRMHHDRAASWFLRSVAVGEGCNVVRQFALLRTSKK
ncbi:MAG: hypothetical protein WAM78_18945 [Candidatus Sulfotelmatobacter sp.]